MYPIFDPNTPPDTGGYMPYFYQRGLHQLYALPTGNTHPMRSPNDVTTPGDSGLEAVLNDVDRLQTVEQIIERGYFAVPGGDPVGAVISDKEHTSWLGLDDVIGQIRHRYELYERNFYQIQLAKLAAVNAIYHHEAYRGPGSADSRQHYAKHKAIQDLYAQEGEERINLWRDVSKLKLLLPESAQNYLSAHRKVAALNVPAGDGE